MNIEKLVQSNLESKKKYAYFKGLGYGEKAAQLLAILPYGDSEMCCFLKDFALEARLDRLYAWLLERNEATPEQAFHNVVSPPRPEKPIAAGRPRFVEALAAVPRTFMASRKSAAPQGMTMGEMAPEMMRAMPMHDASASVGPVFADVDEAYMAGIDEEFMEESALPPMEAGGAGNAENLATDAYALIEEKDAKSVLTAPTSTFRMTTTTASMGILLNQLRNGRRIDLSQVRIEELLNYFEYSHGPWLDADAKFRINTERLAKENGKELLYINVEASDRAKEHQNVILLLDVSGSMSSQADVTLETIATIVSKLREGDMLSLVTYSSSDETVFSNHVIAGWGDKEDIMGRILGIEITGCTYGSAGIETAYTLGQKVYQENWSNQVILITDGDLNFGITKKQGLQDLIEEKKKSGLFLSVIGTGLYNYQDEKLEVLAKHGNGTYCVVNSLEDVDYSVNRRFVSLTNVVAKDVKAQVEFNPKYVKSYRLLGYENRTLAHEDFRNDRVISEPYGSGGHGVALYELEMGEATGSQELKYQQAVLVPSEELCTVKVRFKEPLGEQGEEISRVILAVSEGAEGTKEAAGGNGKLAYFLYCAAEVLRGSDKLDEADRAFFEKMKASGEYKELAGSCRSELELLLK